MLSEIRYFLFQYDGELYLLATDQGYINQPDLVWEKLNEVRTISVSFKWTEFERAYNLFFEVKF